MQDMMGNDKVSVRYLVIIEMEESAADPADIIETKSTRVRYLIEN